MIRDLLRDFVRSVFDLGRVEKQVRDLAARYEVTRSGHRRLIINLEQRVSELERNRGEIVYENKAEA